MMHIRGFEEDVYRSKYGPTRVERFGNMLFGWISKGLDTPEVIKVRVMEEHKIATSRGVYESRFWETFLRMAGFDTTPAIKGKIPPDFKLVPSPQRSVDAATIVDAATKERAKFVLELILTRTGLVCTLLAAPLGLLLFSVLGPKFFSPQAEADRPHQPTQIV
jgi:hypothetical protein